MKKRPKYLPRRGCTTKPSVADGAPLGRGHGTPAEPRKGSASCRVSLPPTRFGAGALWNRVGVRWTQMEHEVNNCDRFPLPGCAARPWALICNAFGVKKTGPSDAWCSSPNPCSTLRALCPGRRRPSLHRGGTRLRPLMPVPPGCRPALAEPVAHGPERRPFSGASAVVIPSDRYPGRCGPQPGWGWSRSGSGLILPRPGHLRSAGSCGPVASFQEGFDR